MKGFRGEKKKCYNLYYNLKTKQIFRKTQLIRLLAITFISDLFQISCRASIKGQKQLFSQINVHY